MPLVTQPWVWRASTRMSASLWAWDGGRGLECGWEQSLCMRGGAYGRAQLCVHGGRDEVGAALPSPPLHLNVFLLFSPEPPILLARLDQSPALVCGSDSGMGGRLPSECLVTACWDSSKFYTWKPCCFWQTRGNAQIFHLHLGNATMLSL